MNPNIAARQLAMNIRFAAPSGAAEMFEPGSEGVLWWDDYADAARGRQAGGLLSRCRASPTRARRSSRRSGRPSSTRCACRPNLVGTRADKDIPLPANVRRYYSPSTRHGGGAGGFAHEMPVGRVLHARRQSQPVDRDQSRADEGAGRVGGERHAAAAEPLSHAGDRGDLVPPTQAATGFPLIPGQPLPDGVFVPLYDYDFGPGFRSRRRVRRHGAAAAGRAADAAALVPKVDADGNELAGVRSVLLEVPLGTYTGWNPIARGFFKGHIQALGGGYIPFAKTKAQRLASGDPRPSLEERYGTHDAYVARVKDAAKRQVAEGFLLQDDADRLVAQAEKSSVLR